MEKRTWCRQTVSCHCLSTDKEQIRVSVWVLKMEGALKFSVRQLARIFSVVSSDT
jgi:hypothetical protein